MEKGIFVGTGQIETLPNGNKQLLLKQNIISLFFTIIFSCISLMALVINFFKYSDGSDKFLIINIGLFLVLLVLWAAYSYKKYTIFDFRYKRLAYKTQILFFSSEKTLGSLESVRCVTVSSKSAFIKKPFFKVIPYYFYEIIVIANGKSVPYVVESGKLGTDGSYFEAFNEKAKEIAGFLNCSFVPGVLGSKVTLKKNFSGSDVDIKDLMIIEDEATQLQALRILELKYFIFGAFLQILTLIIPVIYYLFINSD